MEGWYIGMDFHKKFSQITEMDKNGVIHRRFKIASDPLVLRNYFSKLPKPCSVAIEATRNWYWVCDLIEECGHKVKLAHPKKVRIIAESTVKTDKIDSAVLAHLDRTNFLPFAYLAPKKIRDIRELLRYRMCLVKVRSSLKNRIHAVLAKRGITHNLSDLFGKTGIQLLKELKLPEIYNLEVKGYLKIIASLNLLIKDCEKIIRRYAKTDEDARLLMSVPGFSYFSALLMAAEIGDISRFSSYKKLCVYGGVVSTTFQTGERNYQGHIMKDCDKYIRWILVEAVPKAIMKTSG